jgi:hypothetical protein
VPKMPVVADKEVKDGVHELKQEMQEVKHPLRERRTKTGRWGLAWHLLERI